MKVVLLMAGAFVGYLVAYHTYGRFLARKIFNLCVDARAPSVEQEDGIDYVPTRKGIIFGHHYTSIAGTGPIVGPAIGIIWGWVPALVWVFLGSIFMGAVHDFGAVVISMRNRGLSISECASYYLGSRVRYIFFVIVFLLLMIVIAIFGVVIAAVFDRFPQAVFPVWMEIPIALATGWAIYKRKWNVAILTAVAVALMYITVAMGHIEALQFKMPSDLGLPPTGLWVIILLAYAFVASSLPVTMLLQPRDYINAWQLFIVMGLLVLGVVASGFGGGLVLVAPAIDVSPAGAPPLVPFLFITIACGAISGFHSLVASGTTSKQVAREPDAQFVGYGSMLMEGALAVLVIVAVAAGIGMGYNSAAGEMLNGSAAWKAHYSSWAAAQGLGSKLTAVVIGSANMIEALHIPREFGIIVMGVFIASFAGTTLDTATRIQRCVVAELFADIKLKFMANRFAATAFAVATAGGLAFATGATGTGAMKLWPLFGAGNQLLAALALLVMTNYLVGKGGWKFLVTGIPCVFMLVITVWAVIVNERDFIRAENWLLGIINGVVLVLALWMVVEGVIVLGRAKWRRDGQ